MPGTSQTVTGLTQGNPYSFYVTAVNADGQSLASNEVLITLNAVPGAPTGLTGTAGNNAVALSWTAPTSQGGFPVTSYTVSRGLSPSDPSPVTTVTGTTATTYADLAVTNGTTYYYTVKAFNGGFSVASNQVSVTPAISVPGAPTGPVATAGNGQVGLTWVAPVSNGGSGILGYNVYQGTTPGGESGTPVNGAILVPGTSLAVTGLTNGTTYYFTIKTVSAIGSSAASTEVSATPAVVPAVPAAPTIGTATGLDLSASLTFTVPANNGSAITGFTVTPYIGLVAQATQPFAAPPANATPGATNTVIVTGLANGTAYTFKVNATNGVGPGLDSAASNSATPAITSAPGAPTGLVATYLTATSSTLTWTAPAGTAPTGYNVYVSATPGGTQTFVFNTAATTYAAAGLTPGTPYYFVVKAVNNFGLSPASNEAKTIAGSQTVPGAPTIGTATGGFPIASTNVSLSFTVPENGGNLISGFTVTPYIAGVAQATQTFGPAPATPGATNTVAVTGLTNGTAYTFTVTATNITGPGAASAASNAATPSTVPTAPLTPAATAGNGSAVLTWTAPASNGGSAILGYNVYVDGSLTPVNGATLISAVTYTVTGLTNLTPYTFTVKAVNANGAGTGNGPIGATPVAVAPGAPTGLTATPADSSAMLSWTAPASNGGGPITGYNIYQSSSPVCASGTFGAPINGLPVSGTTATVVGLFNGTQYCFRVTAVTSAGEGLPSIAATVTPAAFTVPSAPTSISASAGVSSAIVAWGIPTSNGNSPITGYVVTPYIGAVAQTPVTYNTASAIQIVPGLTPGTSYTFTVAAINAIGTGANSGFSNFVTPTAPPAPSTLLPGATLAQGSSLVSPNGLFTATVQSDGNFVVYGPTGAIWWTSTNNSSGQNALVLQSDSNLVLSGPAGHPLWWTSTNNRGATGLHMQNDGNLVLYGTGGALWSSRTGLL